VGGGGKGRAMGLRKKEGEEMMRNLQGYCFSRRGLRPKDSARAGSLFQKRARGKERLRCEGGTQKRLELRTDREQPKPEGFRY